MKQIKLIVFTTFLVFGCQLDKDKIKQEETIINEPFPYLIDTIGIEKFIFSFDDAQPTWLTKGNYGIYYIGLLKDTINLYPFISYTPPPPPPSGLKQEIEIKHIKFSEYRSLFSMYFIDWMNNRTYKNWDETKIELRIDTIKSLSNYYPVLLKNIDSDTTSIGYGAHIPIIMEALDSTGNWRPIQERFVYMCGVGLRSIILPPNECVVTLAPIFKGAFKTKLRLTLGKNYSESFNGFISYRQFENRFNEFGDYKDEYKKERKERTTTR